MNKPTLFIFSGLPCSGKSTLAKKLATHTKSVFLRIDTVEQGLRDLCDFKVEGEGYRLSYRIAKDNLTTGNHVIADSVNPIELCRKEWNQTAIDVGAKYINIEVSCSDKDEHKKRLSERDNGIENLNNPTWEQVVNREYDEWTFPRIQIDTAHKTIDESFAELIDKLEA